MLSITLTAALIAGLAGSAHCFGMCGGMASALGMRARLSSASRTASAINATAYHAGRLTGYASVGAIGGALGHSAHWALELTRFESALRVIAGVLTLLVALRILSRWNPFASLERLGARLWRKLQPLAQSITRRAAISNLGLSNVIVGLLWGWLPCGLVYSIALLTLTSGSTLEGSAVMIAFGVGTLPAMLSSTLLAGVVPQLAAKSWFRQATGTAMLACGLWMIVAAQLPTHAVHGH